MKRLFLLMLLMLSGAAVAQDTPLQSAAPGAIPGEPQARPESAIPVDEFKFKDVAGELRCPTCTGLSVLDSEAQFSVQIKDEVKKQLAQGKNKEEILAFFTERYGPWILREPPKEGFNYVAWAVPVALLILGPLGVWFFIWRRPVKVATHGVRAADSILKEMEVELGRMRGRNS